MDIRRRMLLNANTDEESVDNIIYYTSYDGNIVTPYNTNVFGTNIVSNNYVGGQGILEFDGPVIMIGDNAFNNCNNITSVTLPESVIEIGGFAFAWCASLTSVYCKATTPPAGGSKMFFINATDRKIYVPTESVNAYKSAEYWRDYADAIVGYDFEESYLTFPIYIDLNNATQIEDNYYKFKPSELFQSLLDWAQELGLNFDAEHVGEYVSDGIINLTNINENYKIIIGDYELTYVSTDYSQPEIVFYNEEYTCELCVAKDNSFVEVYTY